MQVTERQTITHILPENRPVSQDDCVFYTQVGLRFPEPITGRPTT